MNADTTPFAKISFQNRIVLLPHRFVAQNADKEEIVMGLCKFALACMHSRASLLSVLKAEFTKHACTLARTHEHT